MDEERVVLTEEEVFAKHPTPWVSSPNDMDLLDANGNTIDLTDEMVYFMLYCTNKVGDYKK